MDVQTRHYVQSRAGNRCEYCQVQQRHYLITFHVEHVIPIQHRGTDDDINLALACHHCNRHKGPNLSGIDPDTGKLTRLYSPRADAWANHFTANCGQIHGITDIGRTTVYVLAMNAPSRVQTRLELDPERYAGS